LIKIFILIFLSLQLLTKPTLSKEVITENTRLLVFDELLAQTIALQNSYPDAIFRNRLRIVENGKETVLDPSHPARVVLKSCVEQSLKNLTNLNFQKTWQDCEQQLAMISSLEKSWSIIIESLPFNFFAQEKLKELESKQNFLLLRPQSFLAVPTASNEWNSESILLNHSIPTNQRPYQYLGSSVLIQFSKQVITQIEVRNIYKINKKIEALLKLDPPLSLELINMGNQSPMLTAIYYFSYAEKKLNPLKLSIYPGALHLAGVSSPIRNHQLVIRQLQGVDPREIGIIDEIEFNYAEQVVRSKGKTVPEEVNSLLLEALNMNDFLNPNI
jgi:hypothetical protein